MRASEQRGERGSPQATRADADAARNWTRQPRGTDGRFGIIHRARGRISELGERAGVPARSAARARSGSASSSRAWKSMCGET